MIPNMYSAWHLSPSICTATVMLVMMMTMTVITMMMKALKSLDTGPCRDHSDHVLCLALLSFSLHSNADISDDDEEDDDDDEDYNDDESIEVLGHRSLPGSLKNHVLCLALLSFNLHTMVTLVTTTTTMMKIVVI